MASLRGLNGFEVTSSEIVLDRARKRSGESRPFFEINNRRVFEDKLLTTSEFFNNVVHISVFTSLLIFPSFLVKYLLFLYEIRHFNIRI